MAMGWYNNERDMDKNIKDTLKYNDKALQKIDVKKWLKQQEKWQEEFRISEAKEIKELGTRK